MFVVLGFLVGLAVLELVGLRLDRKRAGAQRKDADGGDRPERDVAP
jgi:hypothetical protein